MSAGGRTHRNAVPVPPGGRRFRRCRHVGELFFMSSQIRRNFAKRLRAYRVLRYDTATKMAEILGVEAQRYSKWEQGRAEPSFDMLLMICQHLGCTPGDLLLGPDKAKRADDGKDFNPIPLRRPRR